MAKVLADGGFSERDYRQSPIVTEFLMALGVCPNPRCELTKLVPLPGKITLTECPECGFMAGYTDKEVSEMVKMEMLHLTSWYVMNRLNTSTSSGL